MGNGQFPRVKRPGGGVNHPLHLAPRLKKEYSYTYTPPLGFHGWLRGEFYLLLRLWNDLLHMSLELLHFLPLSSPMTFRPFSYSCEDMLFTGMLIVTTFTSYWRLGRLIKSRQLEGNTTVRNSERCNLNIHGTLSVASL